MMPPNDSLRGNARMGRTVAVAGGGVNPPNGTLGFDAASSRMPLPPAPAVIAEPMIPYRPYTSTGLPAQARMVPEKAIA